MRTTFVYSTDENYAKLTAVSIFSLLKHNPDATVIILGSKLSAKAISRFKAISPRTIEVIDIEDKLKPIVDMGACGYTSYAAYSRLFIPELLKERFDRAIYLDGDTIVSGSLGELATLDLHGKPFAIGFDCIHNAYKKMIGIQQTQPYFNSGVLLIDINQWLSYRCTERIFHYMKTVRNDLMFGDQDYFSLVLADDAAILPPQYNFLAHYQMFKRAKDARYVMDTPAECWYGETEFASAQASPRIHHFLGHTLGRPWFKESKNPFRKAFKKLAADAGLSDVAEQSRPVEFSYRIQWLCWRLLPRPLFLLACRSMYRYYFRSHYGV